MSRDKAQRLMASSVQFTGLMVDNGFLDRIKLDQTEILVYGECSCRQFRMAAPVNSRWPECPVCGSQVAPSLFGADIGSPDRRDRVAYVAELRTEKEAKRIIEGQHTQAELDQLRRQLEEERSRRPRWRWFRRKK